MLLLAIEVLDREAVQLQPLRLIHPAADRFERNPQQFRTEPGLRLLPLREENLHFLSAGVDRVVALILVVLQRREIPDAVRELAKLFRKRERRLQSFGS